MVPGRCVTVSPPQWEAGASNGGGNYELRLTLEPAHVLLMVGNGQSIDQRDPGTRQPQDNHEVRAL